MSGRRDEMLRELHGVLEEANKATRVAMSLIERELAVPEGTIVGPNGKVEEQCPHLDAKDITTGGGLSGLGRRAMCMDCGETFQVEAEPKPITEQGETNADHRS